MNRRNEGILALIMIIALIAFVIGAAIGITFSFGEHDKNATAENNNTTHFENVTVQMTSNLNNKNNSVEYDYVADTVDYNANYSMNVGYD
ncbi:MAG: hypothetical protein U0K80_06965 [Methanobrevibacter sp.]|nr:hypothetical protein [Methanobrevibacter sp.]